MVLLIAFTRQRQRVLTEWLAKVETSGLAQGTQVGADRTNRPIRLGFQQDAYDANDAETQPPGSVSALFLVWQDQIGSEFKGQGDSFGLTSVQVSL
jgi:hypothetical protein